MKLDKVLEGKHNGISFRYSDGFLHMFDRRWDKDDIKTLIEAANLLSIEGYNLKVPIGKTKKITYDMFGFPKNQVTKTYDPETGEEG